MTRPRIHQFHSGSAVGDAITNGMFLIRDILGEAGIESDIYVQHRDARLAHELRLIEELTPDTDDLLLLHHSMGHDIMPMLQALTCRKLLVYHNITPPRFFSSDSPIRAYSLKGYEQLATLRTMVAGSIADSDLNRDDLLRRKFTNVETIPLLRDFKACREAPYTKSIQHFSEPRYQLLFTGRIVANKGQLNLVRFLAQYRDSFNYPLHLALIGSFAESDGYLERITDDIEQYQLDDRVIIAGHVSDADLYGWYRVADAYVSYSDHEGFGVPMVEAMAFDVPVVAYASSAVSGVLRDAGVLIKDKSPETLATELHRLFTDTPFRRSIIAAQRNRFSDFDRAVVAERFFRFIYAHVSKDVSHQIAEAAVTAGRADPAVPPKRRYVVEGPCETSYSLAIVNRSLAVALDKRGDAAASISPAEGVEEYVFDAESVKAYPEIAPLLKPPVLDAEATTITIRNMYPSRPAGMLGDLRLLYFFWEETAVPSPLIRLMNRYLDGILAPTTLVQQSLRNSGLRIPIAVVGCGIDHTRLPKSLTEKPKTNRPFVFLHVSSGLPRKGIEELFLAYAIAFTREDNVLLIVKTYDNASNIVRRVFEDVFGRRPNTPPVQVITSPLFETDMYNLYASADAAVLPTRGEGFNLPAAEAMAFGIPVIVTNFSGHVDFVNDTNSWLVDFDFERSQSHLKTPGSMWARPHLRQLVATMRRLYQRRPNDMDSTQLRRTAAFATARTLRWSTVADKTEKFTEILMATIPVKRELRLAWVSTWNSKCGIASYSECLTSELPGDVFNLTIFANQVEPTVPDDSNVRRCWTDRRGSMAAVVQQILNGSFDVAVFQFNFGFFEIREFGSAIEELERRGISCFVFFHKSKDVLIEGTTVSLSQIVAQLALAQRVIVHSVSDVNRLKEFGLVDNVVLLPHGVPRATNMDSDTVRRFLGIGKARPLIATYGFLLPNKGLTELIFAFGLLLNSFPDAMLLLVCSEYPSPVSEEERRRCVALTEELGVGSKVILVNDYLENKESMLLLQAADLIVYPYQETEESASGAIRLGLASCRPVATTPLKIFADVEDITYTLPGATPPEIAEGLKALLTDPEQQRSLVQRQARWLGEASWRRIAERLSGLIVGLYQDRHGVQVANFGETPQPVISIDKAGDAASAYERIFQQLASQRSTGLNGEMIKSSDPLAEGEILLRLSDFDEGDDEFFVREVYRKILFREADPSGLEHNLGLLRTSKLERSGVIMGILNSDEFYRANRPVRVI